MEDWSDERLLSETPRVPAAFAVFYRRHEGPVLGYFMRRTGDAELAADLAAETFAAALLGVRRFRPQRGDGVSWLYGIARHRLLRSLEHGRVEDRARRRLAMPRLEIDDDLAERIERLGAEERALELLAKLPADQAGRRRRPRVLVPAGALLAAAVASVLLVLSDAPPPPAAGAPPVVVPARVLAQAGALTRAPDKQWPKHTRVAHTDLAATAAAYARAVPYPPGLSDHFDWEATPADPADMSAITALDDVHFLVEYRAACLWVRFWATTGDATARAGATRVLQAVPAWPAFRGPRGDIERHWPGLARAAAAGDPQPLRAELATNCAGVR